MRSRVRWTAILAGAALAALALLARDAWRPPRASTSPAGAVDAAVAAVAVTPGPVVPLPSPAVVAARPAPPSISAPAAVDARLPMALPYTASVEEWLKEQAGPDPRQMEEYYLGLYAHLDSCMGSVPRGEIHYWLHWSVDEDHIGHGSYEPDFAFPAEGLDEDQQQRFETCVSDYVTRHDVYLPSMGGEEHPDAFTHWARSVTFPIAEQGIYKFLQGGEPP